MKWARISAPVPAVCGRKFLKMKPLLCAIGVLVAVAATRAQSRPLEPLPVVRLDSAASATLDSVRPLSMRFSQPVPLRDVLLLLVRDTGLSLATEPDIEGTFVGELSGVTLRQALDLVLGPHGVGYTVEGSAIRVFRKRPETRIFDINVSNAVRSGSGETAFSTGLPGSAAPATRGQVQWRAEADPFAEITRAVGSLLSSDGRFSVDRKAGVVQVTDYADRLDRVSLYLESVERRLRRQVEIVARLVEVTLSDPGAYAVDWSAAVERARTPAPRSTGTLDFQAFVSALGQQGTVTVLASPRITTLHNEPALVRVGTQDVVFTREGDADRAGSLLEGFALTVTPHISADGEITLAISPALAQKTGEVRSHDGQRVPVLAVDELNAAVRLRDGETLVLPGLSRESTLTEAPARGLTALFRREQVRKARSEVAVLLTAKVL